MNILTKETTTGIPSVTLCRVWGLVLVLFLFYFHSPAPESEFGRLFYSTIIN